MSIGETPLLPRQDPVANHLRLPDEIRLKILGSLDYRNLLRCRLVCMGFNRLIEGSSELQLIIELAGDGMVATAGADGMIASQQLTLLRERRRAWDTLSWRKTESVRIGGGHRVCEMVGGIFVNTFTGRDLLTSWLPSLSSGGKQVLTESLGGRIREISVDPTQDLIIYMADDCDVARGRCVTMTACTISSRIPHPDALHPEFGHQFPETRGVIPWASMHIAGDLVALRFCLEDWRLLMWNWRSGSIVMNPAPGDLPIGIYEFSFISSREFCLVSITGSGSIHVYAIDPMAEPSYIHIAQLHLPTIHPSSSHLSGISMRTSPFLGGERMDKPFTTSPESRLHVISIAFRPPGSEYPASFVLFVHTRTFSSLVTAHRSRDMTEPLDLPWSEWGPRQTRLLRQVYPFPVLSYPPWSRFVEGQRVVCPTAPRDAVIQVLDFNVLRPAQSAHTSVGRDQDDDTGYSRVTITDPTHFPAGIFQEDVVTYLPYHRITRRMDQMYPGYMLDEDRIVAAKTGGEYDRVIEVLDAYVM